MIRRGPLREVRYTLELASGATAIYEPEGDRFVFIPAHKFLGQPFSCTLADATKAMHRVMKARAERLRCDQ